MDYISEQIQYDPNTMFCDHGLSTEIVFTKFLCSTLGHRYGGLRPITIRTAGFYMVDTRITNIYKTIKKLMQTNKFSGALYGPGVPSSQYILKLMNLVYLPSQFFVTFTSVAELKLCLDGAKSLGYKCYAVAGYDATFPRLIVAWIKLIKMPQLYIDLIEELNNNLVVVGIYSKIGRTFGENITRKYNYLNSVQTTENSINEGDIYFSFVNEVYTRNIETDIKLFNSILWDFDQNRIQTEKIKMIGDWECGIDVLPQVSISKTIISDDTLHLYKLPTKLTLKVYKKNNIKIRGVIINSYMTSNPKWELENGLVPFLYWHLNPKAIEYFISQMSQFFVKNNVFLITYTNDMKPYIHKFVEFLTAHCKVDNTYNITDIYEYGVWVQGFIWN